MKIKERERWLQENGYDGLIHPDHECGCKVGDLEPCDGACGCRPAYRGPDPDGESEWLMYSSKFYRDLAIRQKAKGEVT